MITEKQTARLVSEHILEVNRLLNDAVSVVHAQCSTSESSAFRLAIGRVLGDLLLTVVNPLYQAHPDLKPEGLYVPKA